MKRVFLLLAWSHLLGGGSEALPYRPNFGKEGPPQMRPAKPGFIRSPYGEHKILDVRGMPPGTRIMCPFTGKIFLVPKLGEAVGIPVP